MDKIINRDLNYLLDNVILEFYFGSTVYGTKTEQSDVDILCVVPDKIDTFEDCYNHICQIDAGDTQYQFISESTWINMIQEHHIYALEGLWLPDEFIIKGVMKPYQEMFNLDKWKLRKTISAIAENAYAKCHKKLIIKEDFDLYKAQKSLFHAFRVLIFGRQIAESGHITDYGEANPIWEEIYAMDSVNWKDYKSEFKPRLNQTRSKMVELCPKPLNKEDR